MKTSTIILLLFVSILAYSQTTTDSSLLTIDRIYASNEFQMDYFGQARWVEEGSAYTTLEPSDTHEGAFNIVRYETIKGTKSILVDAQRLIPSGQEKPLPISNYIWSNDKNLLLIFTNTKRVWRYNTKGDYWIFNLKNGKLQQIGRNLPKSTLMFAKFSPNDKQVAYVSNHNIYVEDIKSQKITQLTHDGSKTLINGTFDWAYEEEFSCRDGFRWSPDGKYIAYWQVDAKDIRNFLMTNTTDSIYSYNIPVQYPKVGEDPSACKIGVVATSGGKTKWMKIPGDSQQNYLPRMKWMEDSQFLIAEQINRKQNEINLWQTNIKNGIAKSIYKEKDEAWIDAIEPDDWLWLNEGKEFTWTSEKDGWRHLYRISKNGQKTTLVSKGEYDVISIQEIDKKGG